MQVLNGGSSPSIFCAIDHYSRQPRCRPFFAKPPCGFVYDCVMPYRFSSYLCYRYGYYKNYHATAQSAQVCPCCR